MTNEELTLEVKKLKREMMMVRQVLDAVCRRNGIAPLLDEQQLHIDARRGAA